jgi:hypothetical protein
VLLGCTSAVGVNGWALQQALSAIGFGVSVSADVAGTLSGLPGGSHGLLVANVVNGGAGALEAMVFLNGVLIGSITGGDWVAPDAAVEFAVGNSQEDTTAFAAYDASVAAFAMGAALPMSSAEEIQALRDAVDSLWKVAQEAGDILDLDGLFTYAWSSRQGLPNVVDSGTETWVDWKAGEVLHRLGTKAGTSVVAREALWASADGTGSDPGPGGSLLWGPELLNASGGDEMVVGSIAWVDSVTGTEVYAAIFPEDPVPVEGQLVALKIINQTNEGVPVTLLTSTNSFENPLTGAIVPAFSGLGLQLPTGSYVSWRLQGSVWRICDDETPLLSSEFNPTVVDAGDGGSGTMIPNKVLDMGGSSNDAISIAFPAAANCREGDIVGCKFTNATAMQTPIGILAIDGSTFEHPVTSAMVTSQNILLPLTHTALFWRLKGTQWFLVGSYRADYVPRSSQNPLVDGVSYTMVPDEVKYFTQAAGFDAVLAFPALSLTSRGAEVGFKNLGDAPGVGNPMTFTVPDGGILFEHPSTGVLVGSGTTIAFTETRTCVIWKRFENTWYVKHAYRAAV